MNTVTSTETMTIEQADRQQEAIKAIMAEHKVPFERAVDLYIKATPKECPHCHDANKHGDYEGPTCEVCNGTGRV